MKPSSLRIAIAGFGVAGGAAAIGLARAGFAVTVFEQAESPGPVGAGFLLQPAGKAALKKLGLLDEVLAQAWPIHRFIAHRAPGKELSALGMSAHGVARGVLFEKLRDAALGAGVELRAGQRVTDFSESATGVIVRDGGGQELGTFDLLIAADGARSALREKLNPGAHFQPGPYGALWAIGETAETCPHELRQETRSTTLLTGLLPVGPRRTTFFWGIKAGELDALKSAGFPAFQSTVARIFPAAAPVVGNIGNFAAFSFARYGHAATRCLHTRRVVLIGDAAHPMSPHLGQGANLALLDAIALTEALVTHGDSPAAFPALVRARARQNRFYAQLSGLLSPTFQSDSSALGYARDLCLPLMISLPPFKRRMEITLAGGRAGWLG